MGDLIGLVAVVMIFGIPLLAIWTKHRKELLGMNTPGDRDEVAQLRAETRELNDRLRVLERIVTDKGYDVATQIEALRDQRRADEQLAQLDRSDV